MSRFCRAARLRRKGLCRDHSGADEMSTSGYIVKLVLGVEIPSMMARIDIMVESSRLSGLYNSEDVQIWTL